MFQRLQHFRHGGFATGFRKVDAVVHFARYPRPHPADHVPYAANVVGTTTSRSGDEARNPTCDHRFERNDLRRLLRRGNKTTTISHSRRTTLRSDGQLRAFQVSTRKRPAPSPCGSRPTSTRFGSHVIEPDDYDLSEDSCPIRRRASGTLELHRRPRPRSIVHLAWKRTARRPGVTRSRHHHCQSPACLPGTLVSGHPLEDVWKATRPSLQPQDPGGPRLQGGARLAEVRSSRVNRYEPVIRPDCSPCCAVPFGC